MSAHPALLAMDYFGPAISAVLFMLIMSFVPEPTRLDSTRSSLPARSART